MTQRKKPTKVLMLEPSSRLGGAENIFLNVARSLPSHGFAVRAISLRDGPLVDDLRSSGVETVLLEAGRLREPHRILSAMSRLSKMISVDGFDLVYANMARAHLVGALPARRRRIPAVWAQMGLPSSHWLDSAANRLPADVVITLSTEAAIAQRRLGRAPVRLVHPGIDVDRFRVTSDPDLRREWNIDANRVLVSIVGRLQDWKGQREFLQAAALVKRAFPETLFAVVGAALLGWEGSYPAELKRLAEELGIADSVIFTGHSTEAHRWFAASDVTVNASSVEPFGLVIIEAMASGCAVVAVDRGGPSDIIEHGESGMLCARADPSLLANAIIQLVDQPELRIAIGEAGRERVESSFSIRHMTDGFARVFSETVATSSRTR